MLWTLASRRLAEYNASKESIDRIHSTRLKEDILKELWIFLRQGMARIYCSLQVKMLAGVYILL